MRRHRTVRLLGGPRMFCPAGHFASPGLAKGTAKTWGQGRASSSLVGSVAVWSHSDNFTMIYVPVDAFLQPDDRLSAPMTVSPVSIASGIAIAGFRNVLMRFPHIGSWQVSVKPILEGWVWSRRRTGTSPACLSHFRSDRQFAGDSSRCRRGTACDVSGPRLF